MGSRADRRRRERHTRPRLPPGAARADPGRPPQRSSDPARPARPRSGFRVPEALRFSRMRHDAVPHAPRPAAILRNLALGSAALSAVVVAAVWLVPLLRSAVADPIYTPAFIALMLLSSNVHAPNALLWFCLLWSQTFLMIFAAAGFATLLWSRKA